MPQEPLDEEVHCVLLSYDVLDGLPSCFEKHSNSDIVDKFFRDLRVHCSGKSLTELLAEIHLGAFVAPPKPIREYWDSFVEHILSEELKDRWARIRAAQIRSEVEAQLEPALQRLQEPERTRAAKAIAAMEESGEHKSATLMAKLAFVQTPVRCDLPRHARSVLQEWCTASLAGDSEC